MKSYFGFRMWTILMFPMTVWMSYERKIKFYLNYLFANPYNAASGYYMAVVETGNFTSTLYKEAKNAFGMGRVSGRSWQSGEYNSGVTGEPIFAKYLSYAASCYDFYYYCNNNQNVLNAMKQAPTLTPVTGESGVIQYAAFDSYYRNILAPVLYTESYFVGPTAASYSGAVLSSARVDVQDGNIDQYGWDKKLRQMAVLSWVIMIVLILLIVFYFWRRRRRRRKAKQQAK